MRHECGVRVEDLGPYVLGQLDPREQVRVARAVAACPACAAEVAQLRPVVATLARAGSYVEPPSAPEPALDRVLASVHAAVRRRRATVLAAAAAVLVGVVLSLTLVLRDGAGGQEVALTGRTGVSGSVTVEARSWGTELAIDVAGLAPGRTYGAWLADRNGARTPAGTFRSGPTGTARLELGASLALADTGTVGVTEIGGADVLRGLVP